MLKSLEQCIKETNEAVKVYYKDCSLNLLEKEKIARLKNKNITKSEYDLITKSIISRVIYIVHLICTVTNRKLEWFDFNNEVCDETRGYFDPKKYKELVSLI